MESVKEATKKIEVLQAGRAIAAMLVVGYHTNQAINSFIGKSSQGGRLFLEYGYLGVDFFFVLSGFIIYFSVLRKKEFELPSYLLQRLNRIFTPYLPVGILMALLYTLMPSVSEGDRSWGWFTTLTLLPAEDRPALNVAWTLRHEVVFYFVFGLLFYFRKLWIGFALWAAAIFAYECSLDPGNQSGILGQLFGSINIEFLFGLLVAKFYLENKKPNYLLCFLLMFGAFTLWVIFGAIVDQSWLVGLSLAAGVYVLIDLEMKGRVQIPKFLSVLGNGSYSIYLVHPIAVSIAVRIAHKFFGGSEGVAFLFVFLTSITVGMVYYVLIEKPVVNYLRLKLSSRLVKLASQ